MLFACCAPADSEPPIGRQKTALCRLWAPRSASAPRGNASSEARPIEPKRRRALTTKDLVQTFHQPIELFFGNGAQLPVETLNRKRADLADFHPGSLG